MRLENDRAKRDPGNVPQRTSLKRRASCSEPLGNRFYRRSTLRLLFGGVEWRGNRFSSMIHTSTAPQHKRGCCWQAHAPVHVPQRRPGSCRSINHDSSASFTLILPGREIFVLQTGVVLVECTTYPLKPHIHAHRMMLNLKHPIWKRISGVRTQCDWRPQPIAVGSWRSDPQCTIGAAGTEMGSDTKFVSLLGYGSLRR